MVFGRIANTLTCRARPPECEGLQTITGPARRTGGMNLAIFTIFRSVIGREEQQLTRVSKSDAVTYWRSTGSQGHQ